MENQYNLDRFLQAQNQTCLKALSEIRNGKKESHWMWYVLPQLLGLGFSDTSKYYGIQNLEEAVQYLAHPILGKHLIEISRELLQINNKTATDIFGIPDVVKFLSCLTLFSKVPEADPIFKQLQQKYFRGLEDEYTIQLLNN